MVLGKACGCPLALMSASSCASDVLSPRTVEINTQVLGLVGNGRYLGTNADMYVCMYVCMRCCIDVCMHLCVRMVTSELLFVAPPSPFCLDRVYTGCRYSLGVTLYTMVFGRLPFEHNGEYIFLNPHVCVCGKRVRLLLAKVSKLTFLNVFCVCY